MKQGGNKPLVNVIDKEEEFTFCVNIYSSRDFPVGLSTYITRKFRYFTRIH